MGKIKSAICLTLITIVIAVLCVVCFVPFPAGGGGISYFNPLINWTDKSSDLGGYQFGGESAVYYGGSFSVTVYPEGVVSQKEHEDNLANLEGEELEDYEKQYVSHANGAVWLDKEIVCDGGTTASAEFISSFRKRVDILKIRFEKLHSEGLELEIVNDYTVRVTLPASLDSSVASFLYYTYMGNLEVSFGSSLESAERVFPEAGTRAKPITDYIKSAGTRTVSGTAYVALHFTKLGAQLISNATADAENTSGTLFFTVGGDQIIGLTVSSRITDRDLYISGNYTDEAATIISTVVDTAIKYDSKEELGKMELGELYQNTAKFGENALTFLYIALGAALLVSAILYLIRYRRLAFAHIYSYLIFLLAMVICIWAIPTLSIGMNTVAALVITSVVLCVSNAIAFERARKEYALGKTMISSVKTGYRKCFWSIFDLHVVLAAAGLLIYLIGLAELSSFGLVLALGGLFSGIATLAINRFMWYIMMPFAKSAGAFCHFKREEVEDE